MIGIPIYNDLEGLKLCFYSLINSTSIRDKIILLESESTDGSAEFCDELAKRYNFIEVIHTRKEGPLKAYNKLFSIAKDRKVDLFLTQTDVTFRKTHNFDFLKEMKEIAKREDCGIITCFNGGGYSGLDFIDGFYWVGAWCCYIPYRTIEKIGGYDENIPLGWGVDIDYTYAIKQAGLKVYVINYLCNHHPNYVERHEHEKVKNIEELKKEAFAYMRRKWNVLDR